MVRCQPTDTRQVLGWKNSSRGDSEKMSIGMKLSIARIGAFIAARAQVEELDLRAADVARVVVDDVVVGRP